MEEQIGAEIVDDLVSTDPQIEENIETVETEAVDNSGDEAVQSEVEESSEPVLPEDEIESLNAEIQEALSKEDAPNYFRQLTRRMEKAMKESYETSKPFQELKFLDESQLSGHIEMLKALNDYRIGERGTPEPNVSGFVERLAELHPNLLEDILIQIGSRPTESGLNAFQAALSSIGIDPTKIEDYKAFAAGNHQSEYVSDIPQEYREVFQTLSAEDQEQIALMDDSSQRAILGKLDRAYQLENAEKTRLEQSQQALQQEIVSEAEQTFTQATSSALDAFHKTLSKVQFDTDPVRNAFIAEQNLSTVLTALSPNQWGHERAKESLAKIGVNVDADRVNSILTTLENETLNAAFFAKQGNEAQRKVSEAKAARATQELIAQGQKIAAQILRTRGEGIAAASVATESALKQAQSREAIVGNIGTTSSDWVNRLAPPGSEERRLQIAQMNQ